MDDLLQQLRAQSSRLHQEIATLRLLLDHNRERIARLKASLGKS